MNQDENNDTIPPEYLSVEEWRAVEEEEAVISHLSTLRFAPESSILVTHTPPNSVAKDLSTSHLALSTLAPLRDHLSERLRNLAKEHTRLVLSPGPHDSAVAFRRDILVTLQDIIAAQGSIRQQYTHEADLRRSQLRAVSEHAEKERKILQAMSQSTKDIERERLQYVWECDQIQSEISDLEARLADVRRRKSQLDTHIRQIDSMIEGQRYRFTESLTSLRKKQPEVQGVDVRVLTETWEREAEAFEVSASGAHETAELLRHDAEHLRKALRLVSDLEHEMEGIMRDGTWTKALGRQMISDAIERVRDELDKITGRDIRDVLEAELEGLKRASAVLANDKA